MTLVEILQDESRRRAVARDGAVIVDEEVARKRGLRAAALKTGYKTVKKLKPGMIEEAMASLLPRFAPQIDPHWEKAVATGDPHRYFRDRADAIAEDLLSVTDAAAERARNRVMLRVYKTLRPTAKQYTAESVPRLPELIEKHTGG
jgi:hypothetical protein